MLQRHAKVLVNSEGQAELVECPTIPKSEAERIWKAVNEQLNCNLRRNTQRSRGNKSTKLVLIKCTLHYCSAGRRVPGMRFWKPAL